MSPTFDPHQGLIIVHAELVGISGSAILRLALDTGATTTLINSGMLVSIGYDLALPSERVQITTGSGVEFVPRLIVKRLIALGSEQTDFSVLCHTLPPSAGVDGLLGLDFLRGNTLKIDFKDGTVTLDRDSR
jgi:predicted aspartyl protease